MGRFGDGTATAQGKPFMAASIAPSQTGIIIVDHGSRRGESNDRLLDVVAMFDAAYEFGFYD